MVIAGVILVACGATHSLGPLENLKSIHVYFQIVKIISIIRNILFWPNKELKDTSYDMFKNQLEIATHYAFKGITLLLKSLQPWVSAF